MFGDHTEGIEAHVAACQAYQDSTPAFKVLEHPVRMADGDWTCVVSFAEGGVHFVTVAKWRDGAIAEEYIMGSSRACIPLSSDDKSGPLSDALLSLTHM